MIDRLLSLSLLLLLCLVAAGPTSAEASPGPSQPKVALDRPAGVPDSVVIAGSLRPFHVLFVDKSLQTLYLFAYDGQGRPKFLRSFPVSTGKRKGDKVREGDRRTPEGVYFFLKVYHDRRVTIFGRVAYHLNYPDPFDRADGREGNGIYLHGTNRPLGSRDTNGCVVMNNDDLAYLSRMVRLNETPIIIGRRLNWVEPQKLEEERRQFAAYLKAHGPRLFKADSRLRGEDRKLVTDRAVLFTAGDRALIRAPVMSGQARTGWQTAYLDQYGPQPQLVASLWHPAGHPLRMARSGSAGRRDNVLDFLQKWVSAWESRDVDRYMGFYSRRFRAYGMNYGQWRTYKARLAHKYGAIDVQISRIEIKFQGRRVVARFDQTYVSDKFHDVGRKTLILTRHQGGYKIWRENWKPAKIVEARR